MYGQMYGQIHGHMYGRISILSPEFGAMFIPQSVKAKGRPSLIIRKKLEARDPGTPAIPCRQLSYLHNAVNLLFGDLIIMIKIISKILTARKKVLMLILTIMPGEKR